MKLQVISDLHLEFRDFDYQKVFEYLGMHTSNADVGILAGDLLPVVNGSLFTPDDLVEMFKLLGSYYGKVIYVPGNHDYYRRVPKSLANLLWKRVEDAVPNVVVASEDLKIVHYQGQRFLAGSMFYSRTREVNLGWQFISDTEEIKDISWVFEHNMNFSALLGGICDKNDVVITHHLPSRNCVSPRFVGNLINGFFVSDQMHIINKSKPKLWIHGHTHDFVDINIGFSGETTRVFCNPLGYPKQAVSQEDQCRSIGERSIIFV